MNQRYWPKGRRRCEHIKQPAVISFEDIQFKGLAMEQTSKQLNYKRCETISLLLQSQLVQFIRAARRNTWMSAKLI